MKYSILAAFSESIPYIPGLRELTGSSSSAILMMQLEYWFSRYPDGFYKFLEPPQKPHNDYTPGDSWTEELAFGKEEFRAAFDKIGNRFNSKTQYEEAKQSDREFGEKFYSSYFDRQSGLTYYHRDHERLNEFISQVQPRHKGVGKKARKKTSQPQIQNPDHVVNSDLREIVDPNLQEVVISHMTISEDPIYGSGNFRFTDPYIYSEITPEITYSEITKKKDPLTPKGGTGCLSEEGNGESLTGGGEERSPNPTEPQAIQQGAPVKTKSCSEDQTSPAPTPIYSVHKKEHQDRIVAIYQANKPIAWQPVNNLHRAIKVQVDSLLSSEDFQGDLEAFLTRLENALFELNDPTSKFGWFRSQGNLGITTLLSNYGKHLMEFSNAWTERQNPQVRSAAPDPRFLPTDTTAENMATWNAIIKTGAMRGERSPDPEFLEYYRVLLSKCTHYRGKDCNSNHAKSSLAQKWKSEPLKILADAESWLKAKAKTTTSTQVRSIKDLSLEEKMAILQRVQDRKNSQAKGA